MPLQNKKAQKFSEWYIELVEKAELMEYSPVQGCMVIRERAYAIWEQVQAVLNKKFKSAGVKNVYFPLLIPESILGKEASHVEGFKAEVAWVTHGGSEPLGERLALRPTSEAIMYSIMSKWVSSHRDLPQKYNQWCNVIRWDTKSLKPFIRTREFLWQEGHTLHATKEDADSMVFQALDFYKMLCEEYFAIPVLSGRKSESEKFPGALYTTCVECLMPDGKALQAGTSHNLGQNFSKMFDIKYKTKDEKQEFVWQTSWGVSTRLLGALFAIHSDDKGLVLPPRVAPVQVVIVPIFYSEEERKMALVSAERLTQKLEARGVSVHYDDRDDRTPGYKFNDWELKGVPVRIEIGFKDLAKQGVTIARRDTGEKEFVTDDKAEEMVVKLLDAIQEGLFNKAKALLQENITEAKNLKEFKETLDSKKGFVFGAWCLDPRCEQAINEETGASSRFMPFEDKPKGECLMCGKPSKATTFFAKAY